MPRNKASSNNLTEVMKRMEAAPAEYREVAESLLTEIRFLEKTLVKLKANITTESPIIETARTVRENPALKAYNTSVMRYCQLLKQLTDVLPEPPKVEEADPLIDFVKGAAR